MLVNSFSTFFRTANNNQTTLTEGGNVRIETKSGDVVSADRIDLNNFSRQELVKKLLEFFHALNLEFEKKNNEKLWPNDSDLDNGHVFNGSSEHLFNSNISDKEFNQYKSKIGDVDITVPEDKKELLHTLLQNIEGKSVTSSSVFLGSKQDTVGEGHQINCLVKIDNKINVQIDFEFSGYSEGKPSKFAKFSHSSDWEDIKAGFKGVLHKYLLQSVASISDIKTEEEAILLTPASTLQKIKVAKNFPERGLTFKKFSVGRGLRTDAYATVPDDSGKSFQIDGKTAYKERPTSDSNYVQDPEEIAKIIFGPKFNIEDMKKINSFVGIIELCNKYFTSTNKQNLLTDFIRRLFGQGSQGLERDNPEGDYDIKRAGFQKLKQEFGITTVSDLPQQLSNLLKASEETLDSFQTKVKTYYELYGTRSRTTK